MSRRKMTAEMAFGQALREARERVRLSQEALGHAAGRHRTYVSHLERGLSSPSVKTLFLLAEVLGTTPSKLLRRVEELRDG